MKEEEILKMWNSGIDKNRLAQIYKRRYNQNIKLIRASTRHRHDGRFMTKYEALSIVERIIYKSIMKGK